MYQCCQNKFRFFLTLTGIFISAFIFSIATIIMDSAYYSNFQTFENYRQESVLNISGNVQEDFIGEMQSTLGYNYSYYEKSGLFEIKTKVINEKTLELKAALVKTNTRFLNSLIPTFENTDTLYKTKLLDGRGFTAEDLSLNRDVIIIDEILAMELFGKIDVASEFLTMSYFIHGDSPLDREKTYIDFEIIGVISASQYAFKMHKDFYSSQMEKENFVSYVSNIFFLNVNFKENNINFPKPQFIYTKVKNIEESYKNLTMIISANSNYQGIKISSYTFLSNNLIRTLNEAKISFNLFIIAVFIISSLTIMNTAFFSIKERISEIGIRKALGASNEDVFIQFLFEGLVYGIIASIISTILSITLLFFLFTFITPLFDSTMLLILLPKSLALTIILPIFVSIISCLIPSFYASKQNIIKAIKFE